MTKHRPVQAWELWANPILQRYCRSRLRKKHLIPWGLLVLIATLFIVFLLFTISQRTTNYTWDDGARLALVPLVILQMLLLMFLGTGAVAAGIARESIDGMIDYQRLTPMTPLAKIVGYLFGLPVREYVLTSITVPFVVYCAYRGGIPLEAAVKFYSVFLTSVVLYHLTGLVAGSVVKRKFLAGRTAQFFVAILYLILPRLAAFGFLFLVHLTVLPAWSEQALPFLENFGVKRALLGLGASVPWFAWDFSPTVFSLTIQLALIGVFGVILARKWRDADSHILGHGFSIIVFAGFLALVLGNALPLIADGTFFEGVNLGRRRSRRFDEEPYGWVVMTLIGLAIFFSVLLLINLIVPSRHEMLRGFRRAAKLGRNHVSRFSDDHTSIVAACVLILLGWFSWSWLTREVLLSDQFIDVKISPWHWLVQGLSLALPLLTFHLVIETRGWRAGFVLFLIIWVVPPLAAIIMAATGRLETLAAFTASVSGPLMPVYAMVQAALEAKPPRSSAHVPPVREALWFSFGLYTVALPFLILRWRRYRGSLQKSALGPDSGYSL